MIVAGAGGAAHLPGMVAALTTLPVIGVPVKSRALSESLHSIVQMPGIPWPPSPSVGAQCRLAGGGILSVADSDLAGLEDYRSSLHDAVVARMRAWLIWAVRIPLPDEFVVFPFVPPAFHAVWAWCLRPSSCGCPGLEWC